MAKKDKPTLNNPKRPQKSDDHIPRPRNAWIIYLSEKIKTLPDGFAGSKGRSMPQACKVVGELWKSEPEEVKNKYHRMAEIEKHEHQLKYPDYVFQPIRRRTRKGVNQKLVKTEQDRDRVLNYATDVGTLNGGKSRGEVVTQTRLPSFETMLSYLAQRTYEEKCKPLEGMSYNEDDDNDGFIAVLDIGPEEIDMLNVSFMTGEDITIEVTGQRNNATSSAANRDSIHRTTSIPHRMETGQPGSSSSSPHQFCYYDAASASNTYTSRAANIITNSTRQNERARETENDDEGDISFDD